MHKLYVSVCAGILLAVAASVPTVSGQTPNVTTTLGEVPVDSSGVATYAGSLSAGLYSITASYSGDKTNFSSTAVTGVYALSKTAATPYFGPASGTYDYNLQVQIYDSTPGVSIMYTTDGTTPSPFHGTLYEGAVPVTANTTIKAVATQLSYPIEYLDSPVASASYVINLASESSLPQGEWAWESGGPASTGGAGGCRYTDGNFGVYGVLGVAAPDNVPGGRGAGAYWTDNNGNFWIFGGGTAIPGNCPEANDLWMFNTTTKEWTWMSGSNPAVSTVTKGVYGTMGKFAPGNVPGARGGSATWTDKAGNLWLFGGAGYDSNGGYSDLNDLWEFDPSTREWAWMGGSNTGDNSGYYGTLQVASSGNIPGGRQSAAAWTDQKGNFWLFGGGGFDSTGAEGDMNDLWEFNPSTREWAWMGGSKIVDQQGKYGYLHEASTTNIPGAREGGMAWVDELGKFWFFGGAGLGATGNVGLFNDLWMYNPSDLTWTWAMGSAYGGTYTGAAQPNSPIVGLGSGLPGQGGVYDTLGVPDPGNTPGSRSGATAFADAHGNLWMYGGLGYDSAGNFGYLDDLWEFDRTKWIWAWMGGHEIVPGRTAVATYGPYRVVSPDTFPGPRGGAAGFTDKSGNPLAIWRRRQSRRTESSLIERSL
jgi:N-acetylneuraminic acid mutarotase